MVVPEAAIKATVTFASIAVADMADADVASDADVAAAFGAALEDAHAHMAGICATAGAHVSSEADVTTEAAIQAA